MGRAMQFILWLGDFVEDGHSGKPSVKRYLVALGGTVLAGVIFGLSAVIAWAVVQSSGDTQAKITETAAGALSDITMWFVMLTGGNYTLGKLIEKSGNKKDAEN